MAPSSDVGFKLGDDTKLGPSEIHTLISIEAVRESRLHCIVNDLVRIED